ncbi:MAG: flagellar hook-basal body protein FliE [Parvularculaceae bacterium]|nr:MAG: flagellar hook-basal body protein FliE [Parvularculaceae bacterium]
MAIDPTGASSAYAATKKLHGADRAVRQDESGNAQKTQTNGPGSFAEAARSVAGAVAQGEKAATNMIVGEADPHSVIEALAVAELAVETAVTVRDKVVEAYQEILRMPI